MKKCSLLIALGGAQTSGCGNGHGSNSECFTWTCQPSKHAHDQISVNTELVQPLVK